MARGSQPSRPDFRHRFRGLRTATVVLIGILLLLVFNIGSLQRLITAYRERNTKRDSVEAAKLRLSELERQKRSLELGMFEREKSVREAYRLVRPGEKLILIPPEEEKTSGSTTHAAAGNSR